MSRGIVRTASAVRSWDMLPIHPPAVEGIPGIPVSVPGADPIATANLQAEAIAADAQRRAQQVVEKARTEAAEIRAAAMREGFQDGQARCLDEWAEERQQLHKLATEMGAAYRAFCEGQASGLAGLAVEIAQRLFADQIEFEPERINGIVRQALRHVTASTEVKVHLHPQDLEIVRRHPEIMEERSALNIEWIEDPQIERGGCWIESEQGEVDATVGGRLAQMSRALYGG